MKTIRHKGTVIENYGRSAAVRFRHRRNPERVEIVALDGFSEFRVGMRGWIIYAESPYGWFWRFIPFRSEA